jgi:iron complex outermembrane recepter protein
MKPFHQSGELPGSNHLLTPSGLNRLTKRAALTGSRLAKQAVSVLCLLMFAATAWAQQANTDLTNKSVEDLINIEVTSVSKKEEKLFQTAAAVYVITQDDIRRSGMSSVPDLLRMVPGLDVARIDGSKWAISARGFNGRFANKLLVLIDGRSIYSSETSGVWWEVQDAVLEDIERIEVTRGPGGTLWGANAVNGVINIITKHAQETQGGLLTTGGGSEERGFGSLRYGAKIGDKTYYRVYGKYYNRSSLIDGAGRDADDGQQAARGGGRIDWVVSGRDRLMIEGDLYRTTLRETSLGISPAAPFAPAINRAGAFMGGNLLGRWTRTLSERSDMALQVSYDRFDRDLFDLPERNNTIDVDFQHHAALGQRQDIVWGLGYRHSWSETDSTSSTPVQYNPKGEMHQLFSLFAQDEFTLIKDRLRLILGCKIEHLKEFGDNDSKGVELQPSVRALWTPSAHQTIWGAISRALKTPAENNQDIRVNLAAFPASDGTPTILALLGNSDFESETVLAYEAGYRLQPSHKFSFDLATFYNRYNRLQTQEPGIPFFEDDPRPAHLVIPLVLNNLMRGETYGTEIAANLKASKALRLTGSYSFLRMQLHRYAESLDRLAEKGEGNSPQHQFQLHSYLTLPRNFELDAALYYVSRLAHQQVPDYTRLDLRCGWRLTEVFEISAGGQNLLDGRHAEFMGTEEGVRSSLVKRTAYVKLAWRF